MHESLRDTHTHQCLDQEDIDTEWYDSFREQAAIAGRHNAPRHVEVELTYEAHTDEKTLEGVFISMGANYPHLRFEDGSHGFIAYKDDGKKTRLLFQQSWDGNPAKQYKYPILYMEIKAYHFRTPVCPTCDVDMKFGMPKDQDRAEFPTAAWLCPVCFPGAYDRGIK